MDSTNPTPLADSPELQNEIAADLYGLYYYELPTKTGQRELLDDLGMPEKSS